MKTIKYILAFLPFYIQAQTVSYALLDEFGVVTQVITGIDGEIEGLPAETWYSNFTGKTCKKTTNDGFRKNYAGIGYTYDWTRDCFITPKQFDSWIFNESTCKYDPPVPHPNDGNFYEWNEDLKTWIKID